MTISAIRVSRFRNHAETAVKFGIGINALLGENAQGKTNLLEAIGYLSLTKSFYAASDRAVVMRGTEGFDVEGIVESDAGISHRIRVGYAAAAERKSTR